MGELRERTVVGLGVALAALTMAVYLPVLGFDFVNYDDPGYVTANHRVGEGLTLEGISWSLTAFQNGNWHPLTLLSHMADVSLFGFRAAGHHGTSLILHLANVLMVFSLLVRSTARPWAAAFVAALFAVHPLNVQSVAWIAERKNVLSTLFWLLALAGWAAYRKKGRLLPYSAALAASAAALAAKPMAVTLPITLILADFWPLGTGLPSRPAAWKRRALELAPLLALSAAAGILTLAAQESARAIQALETFPFRIRLAHAPVAYAWYLVKAVWPRGLAVFYPHPGLTVSWGIAALSAAALLGITVFASARARSQPYVVAGWLWYLITLAPVCGIVQVGAQAWADRYAYVPLLGIFAAVVLAAADRAVRSGAAARRAAAACGLVVVAALAVAARSQLEPWRDSEALFRRAVQVSPDSHLARNNLGMALVEEGRFTEAMEEFRRAVALEPKNLGARSNLGSALTVLGRPGEAVEVLEEARRLDPSDPSIRFNLAKALVDLGRSDEAMSRLREILRSDPGYAMAPLLLGSLLLQRRQVDEAVPLLERAVELAPRNPDARFSLAVALAARGRLAPALEQVEEALRLRPGDRRAREMAEALARDLRPR